jgi:hypothetical protein
MLKEKKNSLANKFQAILISEGLQSPQNQDLLDKFVCDVLNLDQKPPPKQENSSSQTDHIQESNKLDFKDIVALLNDLHEQLVDMHNQSIEINLRQQMLIRNSTVVIKFFEMSKNGLQNITNQ